MIFKRLSALVAGLDWEKKILLYAGILALVPLLAFAVGTAPAAPPPSRHQPRDVDTLIPKGFVLVPIEVQNYEALDSILGRFGVVDLFQAAAEGASAQRLVAKNVRILRAPQNPTHFAILIAEEEVSQVLKSGGLFTVIVKRAGAVGTEFVKTQKTKRKKIVYGGN